MFTSQVLGGMISGVSDHLFGSLEHAGPLSAVANGVEMALTEKQKKVIAEHGGNPQDLVPAGGGHMLYHHFFFEGPENAYFAKAHDPSLFTDPTHKHDAEIHLKKEGAFYQYLKSAGYQHIPDYANHSHSVLLLKALPEHEGWHWRIPADINLQQGYVSEVLTALKKLEATPLYTFKEPERAALEVFETDGWRAMMTSEPKKLLAKGRDKWGAIMRPDTLQELEVLIGESSSLAKKVKFDNGSVLNHHDARQTNIAWHPEKGVSIVDWSWAGLGVPNGDTTMFLIDLHKQGFRIPPGHDALFNKDYARLLIGYWLKRSAAEPLRKNDTVRYHQFVSAIKAYDLIKKYDSAL